MDEDIGLCVSVGYSVPREGWFGLCGAVGVIHKLHSHMSDLNRFIL